MARRVNAVIPLAGYLNVTFEDSDLSMDASPHEIVDHFWELVEDGDILEVINNERLYSEIGGIEVLSHIVRGNVCYVSPSEAEVQDVEDDSEGSDA